MSEKFQSAAQAEFELTKVVPGAKFPTVEQTLGLLKQHEALPYFADKDSLEFVECGVTKAGELDVDGSDYPAKAFYYFVGKHECNEYCDENVCDGSGGGKYVQIEVQIEDLNFYHADVNAYYKVFDTRVAAIAATKLPILDYVEGFVNTGADRYCQLFGIADWEAHHS